MLLSCFLGAQPICRLEMAPLGDDEDERAMVRYAKRWDS